MLTLKSVAWKNLQRKKARSSLTVIAIALSAWVLISLLGFNKGYEAALNKDIDNMGFQVLVTAKGCPYEAATLMLKGGTGLRYIPETLIATVTKNKEVVAVTPMLMQAVFDPNKGESGGISAYLGVDPKTYPQMKAYFKFHEGGWFKPDASNEVVMGYEAAELEQREVGDKLLIPEKNIELNVVGILKRTGTQDDGTIFIPLKTAQKIFKQSGKLTGLGIKLNKTADMTAFENKMYELPDVQVVSLAQVKQTIMDLVATAKVMVLAIAVIAILIAMLGVMNTVLMSVLERYQEIGILKSMGAAPADIFKLIWYETALLCTAGSVVGIVAGLVLAQLTEVLIRSVLPYTPTGGLIQIDIPMAFFTLILMIVVGIVSGLYPAWRAAQVRPLDAIRSEGE